MMLCVPHRHNLAVIFFVFITMVFEGVGKATWRQHPLINPRSNLRNGLPGIGIASVLFVLYVAYDQGQQYLEKRRFHQLSNI